ncbi:hypothetical protein RLEG3_31905 [Rhizobium leguminosarum bv. trifolii WSM1689]|nr:hypothetical protein RLEG3_31905 [Rhizobium leguminosarum bv. trifolii WSM1689]
MDNTSNAEATLDGCDPPPAQLCRIKNYSRDLHSRPI